MEKIGDQILPVESICTPVKSGYLHHPAGSENAPLVEEMVAGYHQKYSKSFSLKVTLVEFSDNTWHCYFSFKLEVAALGTGRGSSIGFQISKA